MKAMVLSAGFGTRLGDLTKEMPKPMLELAGKPILACILENLRRHDFTDIVINLHFKPEIIRDYFGDGSKFGVKLTYSLEPELLGTAGGVKKMAAFFKGNEPFLVHYGDIVTNQDFSAMRRFHVKKKALATLLLHQRAKSNSIISLDEQGRITGFLERPDEATRQGINSPWVNSGICLCQPEFLENVPPGMACDLPRDIFPKLIGGGKIFGFPLSGYRCAIDSPERLAEARAAVAKWNEG